MPRILIPLRPILGVLQIGIKSQDTIMSNSEHSAVTYTSVSEDDLYMGSPGVDYVPGPEEPEQAPPSPIYIPFVPELVYPEFLPVDDEVFPAEEQPLPAADSPTHQSPGGFQMTILRTEEDDDDEMALAPAEPAAVLIQLTRTHYIGIASRLGCPSEPRRDPFPLEGRKLLMRDARLNLGEVRLMVFWDTWDDLVGAIRRFAPTTLEGVPTRKLLRLSSTVDQEDMRFILSQLDDARYDRALLRARVNRLDSDRPFHRRTALLIEEEARLSRAAWARLVSELLKADHRRQRHLVETLKTVKNLKTQMIELQRQRGPAKDPLEPELPEEASSSS
ncbi:hypothetical protein Tco_0758353 [Tanacetum coccineum]